MLNKLHSSLTSWYIHISKKIDITVFIGAEVRHQQECIGSSTKCINY